VRAPRHGYIDVDQGDVLYLALEDTGRRLQSRLRKVLAGAAGPDRLTLETECRPFPAAAAYVRKWLDEHPKARLVVIDVFAKIRGASGPNTPQYEADYQAVTRAKEIADDYGIAIILVHHVRKASSEDFLTEVSGTNGIAGAADAVLVLKRSRGEADGALHVTGRDVDESEYALNFDPALGLWTALPGPAIDHLVSETRAKILAFLREHPGEHGPRAIADGTGLAYELVKKTCARMDDDGQITRAGRGRYMAVPAVPTVPSAGEGHDQGVPEGVPNDEGVPNGGTCRRCRRPARRLILGCCPDCAYPAGGSPEDEDESL
jgi:hypothetical protein